MPVQEPSPRQDLHPDLVSICIPTYQRPALLAVALASAMAQRYPHVEIVIGDDSHDDASEQVVLQLQARQQRATSGEAARAEGIACTPPHIPDEAAPVHTIRYERHRPSLGQAGNVNRLFARARGSRLVLLHDDDVLEPDALQVLASCWDDHPDLTAAFGKQWIIDHDGVVQPAASMELNRRYHRVEANAGLLPVPGVAGIRQMFPNDAYMVDTLAARATAYRGDERVGPACDFDFGLRLCLHAKAIFFVNRELARYRITDESVSSRSFPSMFSYQVLRSTPLPDATAAAVTEPTTAPTTALTIDPAIQRLLAARTDALAQLAPPAASAFARSGRPHEALTVMVSKDYRWRDRLSLRGAYHFWLAIRAGARMLMGHGAAL